MVMPIFEKGFEVKTYEGDLHRDLRVVTVMNLFQDCADDHASNLRVGMEHCLRHGLAWIGTGYHIKINRMPKIHEKIVIKTWPSAKNRLMAIREFEVRNEAGEILVNASSQWVLLSISNKRPVALDDNLPDFPNTPVRAVDTAFAKIKEVEGEKFAEIPIHSTSLTLRSGQAKLKSAPRDDNSEAGADSKRTGSLDFARDDNKGVRDDKRNDGIVYFEKPFFVRFDDIDINGHVNNAVYPLWATEGVPASWRMGHSPVELEISFKKEGLFGEAIRVLTEIDGLKTVHSIRGGDDRELARLRIGWREN